MLRAQFEQGRAFSGRDTLPERIKLSINDRLLRLSKEALHLARTLVALQDFASPNVLELALGLNATELAVQLNELERAQIITGLGFSHDLLYEAVLQHTPSSVTQLIHYKLAQALEGLNGEAARIAYHWDKSARPDQALPWYLRAAEIATRQGSAEQAKDWLERILELSTPGSAGYQQAEYLLEKMDLEA